MKADGGPNATYLELWQKYREADLQDSSNTPRRELRLFPCCDNPDSLGLRCPLGTRINLLRMALHQMQICDRCVSR
jgi:hypothetical protein